MQSDDKEVVLVSELAVFTNALQTMFFSRQSPTVTWEHKTSNLAKLYQRISKMITQSYDFPILVIMAHENLKSSYELWVWVKKKILLLFFWRYTYIKDHYWFSSTKSRVLSDWAWVNRGTGSGTVFTAVCWVSDLNQILLSDATTQKKPRVSCSALHVRKGNFGKWSSPILTSAQTYM